jgi:import receptor subunit TOM22
MIPASTRRSFKSKTDTLTSWFKSGLSMGGKTLWVVSTSALLLGVPWALAYSEEQMIVEQERAELQAQRAQNEVRNIGDRRERMGRIEGGVLMCG